MSIKMIKINRKKLFLIPKNDFSNIKKPVLYEENCTISKLEILKNHNFRFSWDIFKTIFLIKEKPRHGGSLEMIQNFPLILRFGCQIGDELLDDSERAEGQLVLGVQEVEREQVEDIRLKRINYSY